MFWDIQEKYFYFQFRVIIILFFNFMFSELHCKFDCNFTATMQLER